jgi:hypothetical protein
MQWETGKIRAQKWREITKPSRRSRLVIIFANLQEENRACGRGC